MDTNRQNDAHDANGLQAPPRLVAALRRLQPPGRVFVPPTLDEAVLGAARRHLNRAPKPRFTVFRSWLLRPATVTACVPLAWFGYRVGKPPPPPAASHFAREDLNRDGRVDVLDAFQLARALNPGPNSAADLDRNGDGLVDGRDVELIAAQAVTLEKGGRS